MVKKTSSSLRNKKSLKEKKMVKKTSSSLRNKKSLKEKKKERMQRALSRVPDAKKPRERFQYVGFHVD